MPREDDRNEEIQSLRLSIPTRESDPAPREDPTDIDNCGQYGQSGQGPPGPFTRPPEGVGRAEARPTTWVLHAGYGQIGPWAANAARTLNTAKNRIRRTYTGNHPFQS